jgi:hypothetical protein
MAGRRRAVVAGGTVTAMQAEFAKADRAPDPAVVNAGPDTAGPRMAAHAGVAARPPLRLALFGLPPALVEPVAMLAEILGWVVFEAPPGPAMLPPADLCLAMLPADAGAPLPPIAVWSVDKHLNEHISSHGLSILEQPPCIQHLEQLLQISADWP